MKLLKSFGYAFNGIALVVKTEINAIIHLIATVLVVILGFRYQIDTTEWVALVVVIGMVWLTEILNTAMEEAIDLLHPEQAVAAGRVKDIAAGAVLVASFIAVIVGLLIFVPYLIE